MKKKSAILLWVDRICLVCVLIAIGLFMRAQLSYASVGDYDIFYSITGNVYIVKYNGSEEVVRIPEKINGCPVTRVGKKVFYENKIIKTVMMPNTVLSVECSAFEGCSALERVNFSANLLYLGEKAFRSTGLKEIRFPATLKNVGNRCFYDCTALQVVCFEGQKPPAIHKLSFTFGFLWPGIIDCCFFAPLEAQEAYHRALEPFQRIDGSQIYVKEAQEFSYMPVGEDAVRIVRYWGVDKDVTIPESLDGKTVIRLGYQYCPLAIEPLNTLTIPECVQYMEHPSRFEPKIAEPIILYSHINIIKYLGAGSQKEIILNYNLIIRGDTVMPMPFFGIEEDKKVYVPPALLNDYKTAPGWSDYAHQIFAIEE